MTIYFLLLLIKLIIIFHMKYKISTALMMENPVRRPMVPPIAENLSTTFAALSLVILSNVGVSKYILTNLSWFSHSYSGRYCFTKHNRNWTIINCFIILLNLAFHLEKTTSCMYDMPQDPKDLGYLIVG